MISLIWQIIAYFNHPLSSHHPIPFHFPNLFNSLILSCKSFQDLKLEYAPPNLNSLAFLLPNLEAHILLLHQRSKFGLIIEYVELILHILDHRMLPGHRNISDPYLAFVASSDFYTLLWSVLDHHYALFLLACAL